MNNKIKLTSLLLALSLTLAACSNNEDTTNNNESTENNGEQTEVTNDSNNDSDNNSDNNSSNSDDKSNSDSTVSDELDMSQFNKSIEDAIEEAKSNFDGELTEIGVSTKNNQYVYKIELESDTEEYEVSLDVNDLSVVKEETEIENDPDDNKYFDYKDLVKVEDAIKTAKQEVSGKVKKWSTDFDDGKLYYEITIIQDSDNDDVDVMIDAYSGEFVEIDD